MVNQYFVYPRYGVPTQFDLKEEQPVNGAVIAYFVRGFQLLEKQYNFDGYTVYFVWGASQKLPTVGDNVLSVIYGDEHCRIPNYASEVRAVFKGYGMYPNFTPRKRPFRLVQIELLEYLRDLALWIPGGWRWLSNKRIRNNCHLIPLGYGIPYSFKLKEFEKRTHLLSFQGSISHSSKQGVLRRIIGTPKSYSRDRLIKSLKSLAVRYGGDQVKVLISEGFQNSVAMGDQGYSEIQENTKICVAPRGSSHETWRIGIGLRYGCVVISDFLPKHHFYRGSPIIQIESWDDLPDIVDNLVNHPKLMHDLHKAGINFWENNLSEIALAKIFAKGLGL